ncbi:MAG: hypothetical protein ACREKE_06490, partial [bacterium]
LYTATVLFFGWLTWRLFAGDGAAKPAEGEATGPLRRLVWNKYHVDDFYDLVFVRGLLGYSRWMWRWLDQGLVDGIVNACGALAQYCGSLLRERVQNGRTRQYAAFLAAGVCLLLGLVVIYYR